MSAQHTRKILSGVVLAILASTPLSQLRAEAATPQPRSALLADHFNLPVKAQLRCWYRKSFNPGDLRTDWIEATHFRLEGDWRSVNSSPLYLGSMLFVLNEPEEIEAACRGTLAGHGLGNLIQASAASNSAGQNYEIWYDGDIASRRGHPVERVVSFGDSLSDTGNIYNESRQTFPVHTTWLLGRFSNGPVWTEYLANRLHIPLNTWATGGAQTNDAHYVINGLKSQVDSYVKYSRMGRNRYDVSRTLFTIWIGGNDFISGDREPGVVIADLKSALRTLADRGARKIVVLGLPDLSLAPTFHPIPHIADSGRDDTARVRARVAEFNKALPRALLEVSTLTDAEIQLVDTDLKFNAMLATPEAFGFSEVTTSCLDIRSRGNAPYAVGASMRAGCDPKRYAFWDLIHPTTSTHALISDWVLADTPPEWGLRQ